ncbi:MAG: nuclear transport factor 2 family protein [Pedobacter sp.]
MKLPAIITELVNAQNSRDSAAYADCFTIDAIVFDEGHNHQGKDEIKTWIENSAEKYQTVMEPIEYSESDDKGVLSAKISGTFEGSPLVLKCNLEFGDKLIRSLKITG